MSISDSDPLELAADQAVLEYRPKIDRQLPPATPALAGTAPVVPPVSAPSVAHVANVAATWADVNATTSWFTAAVAAAQDQLAGVTAPVVSDALSANEQAMLRTALGGETVTFAHALEAYKTPASPVSRLILDAWDRAHFGYDGQLGALLYFDLARLNDAQIAVLQDAARRLIGLTAYAMLGNDTPEGVDDQLVSLQAAAPSSTLSADQLIGYVKLHDTIATQISDLNFVAGGIKDAIDVQTQLPKEAAQLIGDLGHAVDFSGKEGVGVQLGTLIGTLTALKTLFLLANAQDWLSFSGLRTRLDQLVQGLILQLIAQAALAYSHIQNQLAIPVIAMIRQIERAVGGKQTVALDQGLDSLVVLLQSVVGKFEQHMLDMYRHTWLHNNLTSSRTDAASSQGKMRNLIKALDQLVSVLQDLQGADSTGGWVGLAQQVGKDIGIKDISLPPLPVLTITKPAPSATLDGAINSPSPTVAAGSPA